MPPKITSTLSCWTSLVALASATLSIVALSSTIELEPAPQQAALRVDVVDDHPRDVGVGDAHERERTGLVRDDARP